VTWISLPSSARNCLDDDQVAFLHAQDLDQSRILKAEGDLAQGSWPLAMKTYLFSRMAFCGMPRRFPGADLDDDVAERSWRKAKSGLSAAISTGTSGHFVGGHIDRLDRPLKSLRGGRRPRIAFWP
jgi:hypothetical protein